MTVHVTISSTHHRHYRAADAADHEDDDGVGSAKRNVSSASATRLILADQFCGAVNCK